jgi:hypothetical protein
MVAQRLFGVAFALLLPLLASSVRADEQSATSPPQIGDLQRLDMAVPGQLPVDSLRERVALLRSLVVHRPPPPRGGAGFLIAGSILGAVGAGLVAGGNAEWNNHDPNREGHALTAMLIGLPLLISGGIHLFLSPIFLGVGGYRQTHPEKADE